MVSDQQVAYVGLDTGDIVAVDLVTGTVLDRFHPQSNTVLDLFLAGDHLYVLYKTKLYVLSFSTGVLTTVGSVNNSGSLNVITSRMRLFVGGDIAYVTHERGINTFDVSVPSSPSLIQAETTPLFGWKQVVPNGTGLGVAAVGPSSPPSFPDHDVSLYDISDPANTDVFLNRFPTPGIARAVTIYNGLAYVANGAFGLHVINYKGFDAQGVPPTMVGLDSNAVNNEIEEGKLFRITANVEDDEQVRNVEFYRDGNKIATDGNFPLEIRFPAPLLADQATFTMQARASDTGGNATFSAIETFQLLPDATPPQVTGHSPPDGAILNEVTATTVTFDEPMAPGSINSSTFLLTAAGPDGDLDTGDDFTVSGGNLFYLDSFNTAALEFSTPIDPGLYRVTVTQSATDLTGNGLAADFNFEFRVASGVDTDEDGVPDDIEPLLGLDPNLPDTDMDTTLDGDEDFDNDSLSNAGEIIIGNDPTNADTNGNGVDDGDEDADLDGLSDGDEIANGTTFDDVDTDNDGFDDNSELLAGTDPNDENSTPLTQSFTLPVTYFNGGDVETFSVFSSPTSFINDSTLENGPTNSVVSQPASFDNPEP